MEVKIEVGIDHGAMDLIISDLCNFPKGNPTSLFHAAESCVKAGLVAASDIIRHQQQRPGKCWSGNPKGHPTVRRVFALAEKALCCTYIRSLSVSERPWKCGYAIWSTSVRNTWTGIALSCRLTNRDRISGESR